MIDIGAGVQDQVRRVVGVYRQYADDWIVQMLINSLGRGLQNLVEAQTTGDQPADAVDDGGAGVTPLLGFEELCVLDGDAELIGNDLQVDSIFFVEGSHRFAIEHAQQPISNDHGNRQFGADIVHSRGGDVAREDGDLRSDSA